MITLSYCCELSHRDTPGNNRGHSTLHFSYPYPNVSCHYYLLAHAHLGHFWKLVNQELRSLVSNDIGCLGTQRLPTVDVYFARHLLMYVFSRSSPHAPKYCDMWMNLTSAFQTHLCLDFHGNAGTYSCGASTHDMHVNNIPLKGGCVGPFSYMPMSLLVVDWCPLWAILWHFRTIALGRKLAVVFL